jgi:hypothetical protein
MKIRSIYDQNVKNIPLSDLHCEFTGFDLALRIRKFINTFCYLRIYHLLVPKFVREQALGLKELNRPFYVVWKKLERICYFWPRPFDVIQWAHGRKGKPRDPANFQEVDSETIQTMALVGANIHSTNFSILDIGCNSGRHMALLWQIGFRNLFGVDAMKQAISDFSKIYPEVYSASEIYHDTFEDFLTRSASRSFDVVFSWSATIELVHPAFDIVKNICKVARYQVILVINEGWQGYPRFWIYEFQKNGFDLSFALRPLGQGKKNTTSLCCFRRRNLGNVKI